MDKKNEANTAAPPSSGVPAREVLSMDSVEAPVDVIHRRTPPEASLPFMARSTGKYREGKGFSYFREGFDCYCLFMVVSGVGEVTYRGRTARIERGDLMFVSSKLPAHTRSLTDNWAFCFVNVAGDACAVYEQLWNGDSLSVIRPRNPERFIELLDQVTAELREKDFLGDLNVSLLIDQLLTEALREKLGSREAGSPREYPDWVREVMATLADRCAEELRVSELAARFYMEQNSFSRRFKRYTGKTPKEYQMACRMERAKSLLAESDLSLSEIAARCGFGSHSFFSKIFRRLHGITPTEYRLDLSKKL